MPEIGTRPAIRSAASVTKLLGVAAHREDFKTADSLSGSRFERVEIDGEQYVLKFMCVDEDWIMRGAGDLACRQLNLWRSPLTERIPAVIDPTVVGCADHYAPGKHLGAALLMRDVGDLLVSTESVVPQHQHRIFLGHMAALHAAFWNWHDDIGLTPTAVHYTLLTPVTAEVERERGGADVVPPLVALGWQALHARGTPAADLACRLVADPSPLLDALAGTPQTLIHGDWKFGNMGAQPDGRTILLDWDRSGAGAACIDLAWYLAVNCALLPETKEASIEAYRTALEATGIETGDWWDAQLGLALIGAFVQLGWSKVEADPAEFDWWQERVLDAQRFL
jgi:hypothetical protein